jgi:hypothetical protein
MNGSDVFRALETHGVKTLHHANTVTTSCTFLRERGLASRKYVESRGLPQTSQYSDADDKRFGIWNDVFTDGVDIHLRGRMRNNYGPVLFSIPATALLDLPRQTEVLVARTNPVHWKDTDEPDQRYFVTPEELIEGYEYGDFGQHVIFRNAEGFVPFADSTVQILLDDPQHALRNGHDAYSHAFEQLSRAANEHNIRLEIRKRECDPRCRCLTGHKLSYDRANLDFLF